MDINEATQALNRLTLPSWVRGREVALELDQDDEPYLAVWLDVDEGFVFEDHAEEVHQAIQRVEECIYALGRDLWVWTQLRQPVPEE
jgi:hypothetical protein